jgi:hypothetical protein
MNPVKYSKIYRVKHGTSGKWEIFLTGSVNPIVEFNYRNDALSYAHYLSDHHPGSLVKASDKQGVMIVDKNEALNENGR